MTPDEIKRGRELLDKVKSADSGWAWGAWHDFKDDYAPSLLTIAEQYHALTAENARLRALVEDAYQEGVDDEQVNDLRKFRTDYVFQIWANSEAKKKLEQPPETVLPLPK